MRESVEEGLGVAVTRLIRLICKLRLISLWFAHTERSTEHRMNLEMRHSS